MKSLAQITPDPLIKNQSVAALAGSIDCALVQPSTPTPLAFPASAPARRDPPGGPRAPVSLPLSVTPYSHSGLTRFQDRARKGFAPNGVGGVGLSDPGAKGRGDLAERVRT